MTSSLTAGHVTSLLCALLVAPLGLLRAAEQAAPQSKPNIVYLLLDDAGYGDFGCYGQKTLQTPNVDRLAHEGMKFTRHYAGSTVCAPSRGTLITGLHTGHSRIRGNGPSHLPDTDLNVARLLKEAGYRTACIGKYGLGSPLPLDDPQKKGFDYFFGYVATAHAHNFYPTFLVRNGVKVPLDNQIIPGSDKKPDTGVATADGRKHWAPQLLADDVQRYLDERAKKTSRSSSITRSICRTRTTRQTRPRRSATAWKRPVMASLPRATGPRWKRVSPVP